MKAPGKLAKQFKYANKAGIARVLTCGPKEREEGQVTLKHMESGEQWTGPLDQAIARIQG